MLPMQLTTNEDKIISNEKLRVLKMQAEVRQLSRRLALEKEISKNKQMLKQIEDELKQEEQVIKKKKKDMLMRKIELIQVNYRKREESEKNTNKAVARILTQSKKKQSLLEALLQKSRVEHQQCYEKALKERKKLRKPINFNELDLHQMRYIGSRINSNNDENEESCEVSSVRRKKSRITSSASADCKEMPQRQQQRRRELKEATLRRKQYGNKVEKEFHWNKAKTESSQLEQNNKYMQQVKKEMTERNKILKSMRKPGIPFELDPIACGKQEIKRIKNSSQSQQDKMQKLNQLYEIYENRLKLKKESINLQLLSQVNVARAQIMLSQNFH